MVFETMFQVQLFRLNRLQMYFNVYKTYNNYIPIVKHIFIMHSCLVLIMINHFYVIKYSLNKSVPQKSCNASHKNDIFTGETIQKCLYCNALTIVYFKNIISLYFSYVSL